VRQGFGVKLLTDAVAGVELRDGDSTRALAEMGQAGVAFCSIDDVI
jgi:hypothetical protein